MGIEKVGELLKVFIPVIKALVNKPPVCRNDHRQVA